MATKRTNGSGGHRALTENGVKAIQQFRAAADSLLLQRIQWMRQAGLSFNGDRDLYEILGYEREITTKQYKDRYHRGGVAKRIVEALPKATWRGGAELVEDENPEVSTAFEDAWDKVADRLKVWPILQRADILAGLSTFSVLLIGAPGTLDTELPRGKPESLLYVTPFLGGGGPATSGNRPITTILDTDCSILEFETDTTSPRFGQPKTYQLRRTDFTSIDLARPVHWTRIIHVAEGCLSDEVYGQPTLENVWNLLDDLDKVTGGGSEAFWLRAHQGLNINLDKEIELSDEDEAALQEEVEKYKHRIARVLKTRGADVRTLGSDVANFGPSADAILTQIAGAKGIPKRILTGSEMGELASSQDRENWRDQVNGRRTEYAGPYIVRRLVDRLIAYGYLPTPKQYDVVWPGVSALTEQERATGAQQWAATNATAGKVVFTVSEIRDKWYGMEPLTDEQLEEEAPDVETGVNPELPDLSKGPKPAKSGNAKVIAAGRMFSERERALLPVLRAALEAGNRDVVDRICGFDPDQPRDDDGKWTDAGGGFKKGDLIRHQLVPKRGEVLGPGSEGKIRVRWEGGDVREVAPKLLFKHKNWPGEFAAADEEARRQRKEEDEEIE